MVLAERIRHGVTVNNSSSRATARLYSFSRGVPTWVSMLSVGVSLLCDQVDGNNLCAGSGSSRWERSISRVSVSLLHVLTMVWFPFYSSVCVYNLHEVQAVGPCSEGQCIRIISIKPGKSSHYLVSRHGLNIMICVPTRMIVQIETRDTRTGICGYGILKEVQKA